MKRNLWSRIYRYAMLATVIWTLLIGFFLFQLITNEINESRELAIITARENLNKNQAIRAWASNHGGVYIISTDKTPPNPYLKNIPNRDLTTPEGKLLTLINPAYLLRLMMNDYSKSSGIMGRLTSLKPLNSKDNMPDEWEEKVLRSFKNKNDEVFEFTKISGKPYLRLMRPQIAKKSCLKCHAYQEYNEGQIIGGLGVSVPMDPLSSVANETIKSTIAFYGLIWILGLGTIGFVTYRGKNNLLKRNESEKRFQENEQKNKALINNLTDLIIILDKEGINLWNSPAIRRFGLEPNDVIGRNVRDFVHPDDIDRFNDTLNYVVQHPGEKVNLENLKVVIPHGNIIYLDDTIQYLPDVPGINGIVVVVRDVTDRMKGEIALRESVANLRSVFENMQDCFYRTDAEGKVIMVSPSVLQLFGYTADEFIGRLATSFYANPDEREKLLSELKKNGKITDFQVTLQKKNGKLFYVSTNSAYWYNNGNIAGVEGVFRDITKHKLAEEALKQSEQRLALHFQQTPLGVIEWNLNFEVIKWNPSAERIFGYTELEILGKHSFILVNNIAKEHVDKIWQSLLERKGGTRSTNNNVRKDGKIILCEWYNTPLIDKNGQTVGVASLVEDITEQKEAAKALQESEEKYRTLFDASVEGILFANFNTKRLEYANPAICKMLGYTEQELTKMNVLDIHPKEDLTYVLSEFESQWKKGESLATNIPCLRKDGEKIYVNINSSKMLINNELFLVGFFTDITKHKLIEEELKKYREQLEIIVYERTIELNEANEELRATNEELEATNEELETNSRELININVQLENSIEREKKLSKIKEEFTSNINHELRTPITGILFTVEYLKESFRKLSESDIQERLNRIEKSGQALLNLINELLSFSKVEAGQFPCELSLVHLASIFTRIEDTFKEMIDAKGLKLVTFSPDNIYFENDSEHIYKILSNLVSNAYKFTKRGLIELNANENGNSVVITIADTGFGIKNDDLNYIFNRFTQGKIQNTKAPGTGIGLHMVKTLTEKHGGEVLVKSELNKGSTFTIILPKKSSWYSKEEI